MSNTNRKNVLLVFGALAIVLVAVFMITRPPALSTEDASGAVAAVEKHHETQITPQDVILGDEATKQEQSVVFADLLNDSAKLQSISAEFGAMAASRADNARVQAASKNLADQDSQLQARYMKYANEAVLAAKAFASRNADQKLASDVADLGARLNSKLSSSEQDAFNARLGIIAVLSKSQSRVDLAQKQVSEAMSRLQSKQAPEAASRLNEAADNLEARESASRLASYSDALEAITMQSKAINAAQSKLASKSMDARQFQSISNDLAQNASQLEARGYNNLAARLNDQAEMGSKLASINAELGAKAQSINYASAAANRANNVSDAMNRLNAALASRQAEYASHAAASINFASRDLASRQASNREVASKALAAMQELGARPEVAAKLDAKLASRLSAKAN